MGGTVEGGKRAAITNKLTYGADFYKVIGEIGGKRGRKGGFYSMDPAKHREASSRGGKNRWR